MAYGRDEHRYALRRIEGVARDVEGLRNTIRSLRVDLHEDDPATTGEAREHLRRASQSFGSILADLDNAATDLPTPVVTEWDR